MKCEKPRKSLSFNVREFTEKGLELPEAGVKGKIGELGFFCLHSK